MVILQDALPFLVVSFNLVLAALSLPPYTLRITEITPVSLSCYDPSTEATADVNEVTFWRNRSLPNDPGLRERSDMPVFGDQTENDITFTLTREFEGYYTCGRQLMDTVERESPPIPLVCKFCTIQTCIQFSQSITSPPKNK